MKLSIIVPCFNAAQKIGACLNSLMSIDMDDSEYEVIFVDDCSTDATYELLKHTSKQKQNWKIHRLSENSGSPSHPRNFGTKLATGEYILYLDCDDEILSDTPRIHYEMARQTDADMLRGYLYVDNGNKRIPMNRLETWDASLGRKKRIQLFLEKQSLTKTCLIRRKLLSEKNIIFPEDMKMGEDTVFVAEVLCAAVKTEYIDHPTYIYNKAPSFVQSTTQSFGNKELKDQLLMWPRLKSIFDKEFISYYKSRLHVNIQYIISLLIEKNRRDIEKKTFYQLCKFIESVGQDLDRSGFSARQIQIIESIESNDFDEFDALTRPRLLLAGHDLKFISQFYPLLSQYYTIKVDKWTGHNEHDEKHSIESLEWAEYIWCEWLLGNAVWYSKRKKKHQRLIVRMHRFEVGLDYGSQIIINNVDAIVTVCTLFFERLLEKFPNISREKLRLIPIGYNVEEYDHTFYDERLYTLGLIGILPSGKGFMSALHILNKLRKIDSRYKLEVFGKKPDELSWILNDPNEIQYFSDCENYIESNNLVNAIHFNGHSDVRAALAERRVGYVLSLSKQVYELPGFEAFHVAVGDGFCGGAVSLVRHYLGAESVWDEEFVLDSIQSVIDKIRSLSLDKGEFIKSSIRGRDFVASRYSAIGFVNNVKVCYEQLTL